MKIISIIPARGGSKRLLRKNVLELNKKPLIAYTIEASLNSKKIDKTIVSTDNEEIKIISEKYGAKVIMRPNELAQDSSSTYEVINHVLEQLNNYTPDIIILLQPTSPLRNEIHIKKAIDKFLKSNKKTLVSFKQSNPMWTISKENNIIKPILGWKFLKTRKQDLPKFLEPNGAIYISTPKFIIKNKNFFCKNMEIFEMNENESIDIDTKIDFKLAEYILKENEKNNH